MDQIVLGWLVRIIMAVASVITGWFVTRDAPNHSLIEMAVGLFLITIFVAGLAFGPAMLARFRNRTKPRGSVDS